MLELINDKKIFTVSSLNKEVKKLLESHFQVIWVEGEVSNLSRPSSGHLYFTLKDETAQIRCAMFRMRNSNLIFPIENGMHILACAKISLYDARGDYQLIVEHVEERGEGLLRRQFELLKKSLAAQGLFDSIHKKSIPSHPRQIGVITSPTGAAIRDVLSVLKRRFASLPIIIYPTQVQGDQAPLKIKQAIMLANQRNECDVIIVCRGGGSLEDLWAFNDEQVARAIFESHIPIVSGIGHEVDITIADFVADIRAATPSAAAELVSPDKSELQQHIANYHQRLIHLTLTNLKHYKNNITTLHKQFIRPEQWLRQHSQMIDIIEEQLKRQIKSKLELALNNLHVSSVKLHHYNPFAQLKEKHTLIANYQKTLTFLMKQTLQVTQQKLQTYSRMLNAVSPLKTLERGYSITSKDGHVVDAIEQVKSDDKIKIELKNGYLHCLIEEVEGKV